MQRGDLDLNVQATGELRANHTMVLTAPPVGGGALQITRLLHTGTPVKKGDIVFDFDPAEQRYKLEQSQSELLQAEQEIAKATADAVVQAAQDKVALLKARFAVRRAELEVQKNELVSVIDAKKNQLTLEQAKGALAKLEQDIKSHTASGQATVVLAQEKRNKAKLIMNQAQQNIEKMVVTAPMDGLVAIEKNNDSSGGLMWPGMSIPDYRAGDQVEPGSAIAQVIDPTQMELTAKVGEEQRSNVKVGQAVEVEFDSIPGQIFQGTVKSVGGMSTRQFWESSTGGKFDISIQLGNEDPRLRPGLTAQIVILGDKKKDVLYVPRQALFMKNGKRIIYQKSGQGFEQREVKILCENESRAAVEGLNPDEKVALLDPTAPKKAGLESAGSDGVTH
ncbi:MAG: efflux RND transporter periplasmic adaptor subunit [Terriglobales bacterium]